MPREPWQQRWIDYYQVLGVEPTATDAEILEAYRYKALSHHPDRFASPELKKRAEQDFVNDNEAYEVLKDPVRRAQYDSARQRRRPAAPSPPPTPPRQPEAPRSEREQVSPRPVLIIDPPRLSFENVPVGQKRTASFVVRNAGGPWSALRFERDPKATWLTLVKREALSSEGLLPMTVEVEVSTAGLPEGTPFVGTIEVCLDDQARPVVVTLETAPARGVVPRPVYQTPRPLYTERPRSVKAGLWDGIVKGVSALVVIAVGLGMAALLLVWQVTAPSDQASTRPGASPVAAPPGLKPPTAFVVANTEGRGTFLRGRACDWADRTATLPEGAELKTLGDEAWCEPVAECRDHVWLKVTSPKGEGWIPRCFVKERR